MTLIHHSTNSFKLYGYNKQNKDEPIKLNTKALKILLKKYVLTIQDESQIDRKNKFTSYNLIEIL